MTERMGLVHGRLEGARLASGEVLVRLITFYVFYYCSDNFLCKKVFLDAPPLLGNKICYGINDSPFTKITFLEPIALRPRLITTPIVDSFAFDTFEYRKLDDGGRGIFNWNLHYRRFPRRPQDKIKLDEPIQSPVMVHFTFYCFMCYTNKEISCRLVQHLLLIASTFGISDLTTMDLRYGRVNSWIFH